MKFILAVRAFLKAWKQPDAALQFIENKASVAPQQDGVKQAETSHLRLLGLLQHSGRLVDFLKEDIAGFSDAQIGAAARKVHEECSKLLEEVIAIRPVLEETEGSKFTIPAGYDPASIKIVGNVQGNPPFTGILVHKGWKAHKRSLPKKNTEASVDVICPAEVELR